MGKVKFKLNVFFGKWLCGKIGMCLERLIIWFILLPRAMHQVDVKQTLGECNGEFNFKYTSKNEKEVKCHVFFMAALFVLPARGNDYGDKCKIHAVFELIQRIRKGVEHFS